MNYVPVEEVSKALDTLSKYLNVDDMGYVNKKLAQAITDYYDNQSIKLSNIDCKTLGLVSEDMLNEEASNAF